MTTYNQMAKNLAIFLRDELKQLDDGPSSLDFSLNISGRVNDGDLDIEYVIGNSYSSGGQVKGGDVAKVVDEYKRRFGWDKQNKPLCIGYNGEEA